MLRTASGPLAAMRSATSSAVSMRLAVAGEVAGQAHLVGALAGDRVADEEHVHRHRVGDLARQPDRAGRHREQAALHLGDGELGVLGDDADVEGLEDLHAAGVAVALDRRDDRLLHVVVLQEALVDEAEVLPDPLLELVLGRLARGERADEAIEVGAGGEVAVGAGHDPDAQLGVAVEQVPRVAEAAEHLGVEGVALVGPVQRDGEHVAVALGEHRGFRHAVRSSGERAGQRNSGMTCSPMSWIVCITLSCGILYGFTRQSSWSTPAAS